MTVPASGTITWFGHACFEVRSPGGRTILIDPWFGNPTSPRAAASVDQCDILLVTHGHGDHLGDSLEIARRTGPTWPAIHEIDLWTSHGGLAGSETNVIGMNIGGTVKVGDISVTMVPAVHSAGGWADPPVNSVLYLGQPAGFIIELEDGFRLYHAGDTTVFGDMRLIGELYRPDLAMLPIGGHYTMGPREAALAVELLGVRDVMPMHYGTFPILAGTPTQLRTELAARGVGGVAVRDAQPGDVLT